MKLRLFFIVLFSLCATALHAQGFWVPIQYLQQGTISGVTNAVIIPPSPVLAFCNAPANAVPCTNKAATYTDSTLGTLCSTSTQFVLNGTNACVGFLNAQNLGGVWVAAGQYAYTVSVGGANFGPFFITAGGAGGGGGGGPLLQTNGTNNTSQTVLNLKGGTGIVITSDGVGGVTITSSVVPTAPGIPTNSFQFNCGGVFCGAPGISTPDSGNSIDIKGPAPYSDIVSFGARITGSPLQFATNTTCFTGSPNVTVAAANFINGDGVTIQGCGATNTMTTPTAPTVTPSYAAGGTRSHLVVNSPTAAATYLYKIVAEDKGQGLTAPSATTTIATGQASIGEQTVAITSVSRVNDVMTVNLGSSVTLTLGQMVYISCGGTQWSGEARVATSAGTSFTVVNTAYDSRAAGWSINDSQTSLTCSGTLYYYQGNALTWPMVTGARRFWVCASRPGDGGTFHVVGQSDMSDSVSGWQGTAWEDWGATYEGNQTFPYYVTDAICTGSATNDSLTTTVLSGGGTTSLTLATNAIQNASGQKANLDTVPAIQAAEARSHANHGCVFIPAPTTSAFNYGFPINSFLKFSSFGAGGCVVDEGLLQVNDTIELSQTYWTGSVTNQTTPAFGWNGGGEIQTFAANPTLHLVNSGNYLDWVYLIGSNNAETFVVNDGTSSIIDRSNFISDSTQSTDYLGMDIIYRNTSGTIASHKLQRSQINGGPDQVLGKSWTPLISIPEGQLNGSPQNSGVQLEIDHVYANRRGIEQDSGFGTEIHHWYIQGPIMPTLLLVPQAQGIGFSLLDDIIQDTSGEPVVANITAGGGDGFEMFNVSGSATNPVFSGSRPPFLEWQGFNGSGAPPDRWANTCGVQALITAPYETGIASPVEANQPLCTNASPLAMLAGYSIFWPLGAPLSITATVTNGGTLPASKNYIYSVSATGLDGSETIPQPIPSAIASTSGTCTGSGNCSVTVGWAPVSGAMSYNIWRCDTSLTCTTNGVINIAAGNWIRVATHVTGISALDTNTSSLNNLPPNATATGISGMNNNLAWAPIIQALNSSIVGLTPPTTVCSTASGVICFGSGTVPCVPTAGQACIRFDKTTDRFVYTLDGSAEAALVGASGAPQDLIGQTAAIGVTNMTNSLPATAIYRLCFSADITTAAGTSSTLGGANGFQVIYTSPTDSVQKTTVPNAAWSSAANTTATAVGGCQEVYAKAATPLQFSFGYASNAANVMTYEFHIRQEDGN